VNTNSPATSSEQFDQPEFRGTPRNYIICSTARSGSTLLASLLIHTRKLGVPHEYLNFVNHVEPLFERWGLGPIERVDPRDYFVALHRFRTTPNGIFGLKAHPNQLSVLTRSGLLEAVLPSATYVHVRRRDVVLQAVSFLIAEQTGKWTSHGVSAREPEYDAELLVKYLNGLHAQNQDWDAYFRQRGANPVEVVYEDLLADPAASCQAVSDALDVGPLGRVTLADAHIVRQGGELNAEWARRFRSERGDPDAGPRDE
jgi:LPS sulfotransferase NodH